MSRDNCFRTQLLEIKGLYPLTSLYLHHLKVRNIVDSPNYILQMKGLVRVPSEEFVFDFRRSRMGSR